MKRFDSFTAFLAFAAVVTTAAVVFQLAGLGRLSSSIQATVHEGERLRARVPVLIKQANDDESQRHAFEDSLKETASAKQRANQRRAVELKAAKEAARVSFDTFINANPALRRTALATAEARIRGEHSRLLSSLGLSASEVENVVKQLAVIRSTVDDGRGRLIPVYSALDRASAEAVIEDLLGPQMLELMNEPSGFHERALLTDIAGELSCREPLLPSQIGELDRLIAAAFSVRRQDDRSELNWKEIEEAAEKFLSPGQLAVVRTFAASDLYTRAVRTTREANKRN